MKRRLPWRRVAPALLVAGVVALGMSAPASAGATQGVPFAKHVYPLVSGLNDRAGLPAKAVSVGNGFGKLQYGGGPIQKSPKVFVVYWGWHGSDPSGEAAYLERFLSGIGGSGWANIQTQYTGTGQGNITNPSGQFAGSWYDDTSNPSAVTTDAEITAEGLKAAQHFGFNPDADYFVATPTGTGTSGFKTSYCAYHSAASSAQGTVAYTYLPYITDAGTNCGKNFVNGGAAGNLDGVSIVGGHEYAEAVTDPHPSSGWVDATGAENGDKCAWKSSGSGAARNISLSTGSFAVQSLFSNASGLFGGCVSSY
jgi:serine protease